MPTLPIAEPNPANVNRPTLSAEQFDSLQQELDALRDEIKADLGEKDANYIKKVIRTQRSLEIVGRTLIHFSFNPITFLLGVGALSASKILDNMEIGHNVLHGQYDWMNDPKLNSKTYEWENLCDAKSWQRTHNFEHHAYTNIVGKDRDFGYAIFRVSEEIEWRPPHKRQLISFAVISMLFQLSIAFHKLEYEKIREKRFNMEEKKSFLKATFKKWWKQTFKDYVFFPLLAGPFFWKIMLGNALANLGRNLWASAIIYCGHFPDNVQTFTEEETKNESRGQWYFRQMLGSANITGGKLMHLMSGHLSYQVEHHLFPDIPAIRYQEMAPRVQAICAKYGIPYNTGSFGQQYWQVVKKIIKYARPPKHQTGNPELA
jgi:fatty acid desaturase